MEFAGYTARAMTSELQYPYAEHPAPGTTVEVADGVRWLTMPMPGSLNHINLYLLEDDGIYRFRSIDPDLPRRAHPGAHDAPDDGPIMV